MTLQAKHTNSGEKMKHFSMRSCLGEENSFGEVAEGVVAGAAEDGAALPKVVFVTHKPVGILEVCAAAAVQLEHPGAPDLRARLGRGAPGAGSPPGRVLPRALPPARPAPRVPPPGATGSRRAPLTAYLTARPLGPRLATYLAQQGREHGESQGAPPAHGAPPAALALLASPFFSEIARECSGRKVSPGARAGKRRRFASGWDYPDFFPQGSVSGSFGGRGSLDPPCGGDCGSGDARGKKKKKGLPGEIASGAATFGFPLFLPIHEFFAGKKKKKEERKKEKKERKRPAIQPNSQRAAGLPASPISEPGSGNPTREAVIRRRRSARGCGPAGSLGGRGPGSALDPSFSQGPSQCHPGQHPGSRTGSRRRLRARLCVRLVPPPGLPGAALPATSSQRPRDPRGWRCAPVLPRATRRVRPRPASGTLRSPRRPPSSLLRAAAGAWRRGRSRRPSSRWAAPSPGQPLPKEESPGRGTGHEREGAGSSGGQRVARGQRQFREVREGLTPRRLRARTATLRLGTQGRARRPRGPCCRELGVSPRWSAAAGGRGPASARDPDALNHRPPRAKNTHAPFRALFSASDTFPASPAPFSCVFPPRPPSAW
eukprot:bmy_15939T0